MINEEKLSVLIEQAMSEEDDDAGNNDEYSAKSFLSSSGGSKGKKWTSKVHWKSWRDH